MVVSVQTSSVTYIGNDATTQWAYPFPVTDASWLYVKTKDQLGTLSIIPASAYTVSGIGSPNGGFVSYPLSGVLPTGWRIRIQRIVPLVQNVEIVNQGAYYPEVMEGSADYKIFIDQQLDQRIKDLENDDPWG